MTEIRKAAVLGSGVMGGGIAAHIANAGIPVVLLDIVPKGAKNRNEVAEKAIDRLLKQDPAAFMHPGNASLVTPPTPTAHSPLLPPSTRPTHPPLQHPPFTHRPLHHPH